MESLRKESFSSDLNSSKRESIESMNRSIHKNYIERKVSVDKRYLDKLLKFCKNIIQELNIDSKEIKMIEQFIQTEENSNATNDYKAEEILDFTEANNSLKIENENLQKKIINLSSLNYDLSERNSVMDNLVKSKENEKVKLENQISLLNDQIELLKTQLEEEISAKSRLEEENILLVQENHIKAHYTGKEAEEDIIEYENDSNSLLYNEKYNKLILDYLEPKDILNFALVDRKINKIFIANNLQTKAYKTSIENKNKEIIMLKSVDWIRDYNISEPEVDRLVREYIQQNKIPGMDLKNMTIKALNYIEQEVKRPLGLSTKEEEKRSKSIIGRYVKLLKVVLIRCLIK